MRILIGIIGLIISICANADYLTIKSSSFTDQGTIPALYSCDGKNVSPQLSWKNAPANTQSFVLIVICPDPSIQPIYYNWVLYNMDPTVMRLPEGANEDLPDGTMIGNNSMGDAIYRGPCPPDDLLHHYIFTIYALDKMLDLAPGADVDDVFDKMRHHVLQKAQLTGLFRH